VKPVPPAAETFTVLSVTASSSAEMILKILYEWKHRTEIKSNETVLNRQTYRDYNGLDMSSR